MPTDHCDYIEVNPAVRGGRPVVRGTRLTVEFLLDRLANGWSEQDLLDSYSKLSKEALQAVYQHAAESVASEVTVQVSEASE